MPITRSSTLVALATLVSALAACGDDSSTSSAGGAAGSGGSTGGSGGQSGASGSAGTAGSGGVAGSAGSAGSGGSSGTAGVGGSGGAGATGGTAGSSGTGGTAGGAGTSGAGGSGATGGSAGSGGAIGCQEGSTQPCYTGPVGTLGIGICAEGIQFCVAGEFGACENEIVPQAELCNGLDDNCDGAVDENNPGAGGTCQATAFGECANGHETCDAGGLACVPADPVPELCDGLDNNCDGAVDEQNPGGGGACSTGLLGVCAAGTFECSNAALTCTQTTAASAENCATAEDENCDGNTPACTGATVQGAGYGGTQNQLGKAVAVDSMGSVYVAGSFQGVLPLGGSPVVSSGGQDAFLAKLDSNGVVLWSKKYGDTTNQFATSVAVDPTDNVIVAGGYAGSIDFGVGPTSSAGANDIFVAKLNFAGNAEWAKSFGNPLDQVATGVATDALGNVYIVGWFSGTVNFGTGPLVSAGGKDVFLVKLAPEGSTIWAKRFGFGGDQQGFAIAVSDQGTVTITGAMAQSADFGGGMLTAAGAEDIFVAQLDPGGNHLWSIRAGDTTGIIGQRGLAIASDPIGNVFVAGEINGSADFGGGPLTSAGLADVFVAAYDVGGAHLWSKRYGDASDQRAKSIALDAFNNVVVTGEFSGALSFGADSMTSSGQMDSFVAKLDPNGVALWQRSFGSFTGANDRGEGVAVDATNGIWCTGTHGGAIDFGAGPVSFGGGDDMYLVHLAE